MVTNFQKVLVSSLTTIDGIRYHFFLSPSHKNLFQGITGGAGKCMKASQNKHWDNREAYYKTH